MSLSPNEIKKIKKLISLAQALLDAAEASTRRAAKGAIQPSGKRTRRIGKELAAFRKMLMAERKKGVRVEEIASKHGLSTAYIYQLG
jgi:hypothetical protein